MFSLWCIDWVWSHFAYRILCISVLRVASGPRVKLASCISALTPTVVYSTDRSKAVVPMLVLLCVALFILRGDLLYVLPCFILFLCFSVLLALRLPRLGKRKLILVLFVRLFDLCLFGFCRFSLPRCLGRAAVWDCGTPWTFLLPFISYNSFFIICSSSLYPSIGTSGQLCVNMTFPRYRHIIVPAWFYHDKVTDPARNKRTFVNWSCTKI